MKPVSISTLVHCPGASPDGGANLLGAASRPPIRVMSDREDLPSAAELDPEDAFGLFSHEIRVEILLALWRASDHALGFEDLRSAVGVRDKGQFNYHLSQLVGQFVDHANEEYELRYAGHRVIDAIQSGVFHEAPSIDAVKLSSPCRACGGRLAFEYADHVATVRCPDCGETAIEHPFDPGGLGGREGAAVARAFSRQVATDWSLATGGLCPTCTGPVTASVVERDVDPGATDHMYDRQAVFDDHPAFAVLECERCSFFNYVPAGAALLDHPGIAGPLFDAGIDVRDRYLWDLPFVTDGDSVAVGSTDPWRVEVSVSAAESDLRAVLDGDLAVRRIERTLP